MLHEDRANGRGPRALQEVCQEVFSKQLEGCVAGGCAKKMQNARGIMINARPDRPALRLRTIAFFTTLAFERVEPVEGDEYRTLDRCLDNAIAMAVTEYAYQRDIVVADKQVQALNVKMGFLAHELRNVLHIAADRGLLLSALGNLLQNTFKFTEQVNRRVHAARRILAQCTKIRGTGRPAYMCNAFLLNEWRSTEDLARFLRCRLSTGSTSASSQNQTITHYFNADETTDNTAEIRYEESL